MNHFRHIYNLGEYWYKKFKKRYKGFYDFVFDREKELIAVYNQYNEHIMTYLPYEGTVFTDLPIDKVYEGIDYDHIANEDVGAPMTTLNNTPGMGNVTPAGVGAIGSGDKFSNTFGNKVYTQNGKAKKKKKMMKKRVKKVNEEEIKTYAYNAGKNAAKSGIKLTGNPYEGKLNRRSWIKGWTEERNKNPYKIEEENLNPYDKLGKAMLKKAKIPSSFKKKKDSKNQNAMVQRNYEHQIITLDEFTKQLNESKLNEANNIHLDYNNTYWEVLTPFSVYVLSGYIPGNAYYGNANIRKPLYKKIELQQGDQLHALVGGTFVVTKTKKIYEGPHMNEPEYRPFEHRQVYDKFPLENLENITDQPQKINKPKSYR